MDFRQPHLDSIQQFFAKLIHFHVENPFFSGFSLWLFEHFLPMPGQKLPRWEVILALRFQQRVAMPLQQSVFGFFTARHVLAENQLVAIGQYRESTQIENLVVQRAQRQTVAFDIRPPSLEPFDVGGFQADGLLPETQVVATDTTTIFVGAQYTLAETRVAVMAVVFNAFRSGHAGFGQAQAHCGQDVGMECFREMGVQDAACNFL